MFIKQTNYKKCFTYFLSICTHALSYIYTYRGIAGPFKNSIRISFHFNRYFVFADVKRVYK